MAQTSGRAATTTPTAAAGPWAAASTIGRTRRPAIKDHFTTDDFLNGLFSASDFPKPVLGTNGNLGRNTFRGPQYMALDLTLSRSFSIGGVRQLQLRVDAYNALNNLNLFLPNADLSISNFGKSTQAFDPRIVQLGLTLSF